jgi:hypothetical protein
MTSGSLGTALLRSTESLGSLAIFFGSARAAFNGAAQRTV